MADTPHEAATPAVPADQTQADQPNQPTQPAGRRRPPAWRRTWLSPGGISAIVAVLTLVIGIPSLLFGQGAGTPPAAPAASATPSAEKPALFVYGSSMPGMSRYGSISAYVTGSARDAVDGLLYDSGVGYPLAKFGTGGTVRGVVLWLDPETADAAMAEMTRVEAGLFHPVRVRTHTGVTAYAYEWLGATDGLPRIDAWDGTTAHFGQTAPWSELEQGDCFQPGEDTGTVVTMWCEAPHPWEVSHSGALTPGEAGLKETAEAACVQAHTDYVGRPRSESALAVRTYSSSGSGGNGSGGSGSGGNGSGGSGSGGGARVLCAVGEPEEFSVGSLRNSQR